MRRSSTGVGERGDQNPCLPLPLPSWASLYLRGRWDCHYLSRPNCDSLPRGREWWGGHKLDSVARRWKGIEMMQVQQEIGSFWERNTSRIYTFALKRLPSLFLSFNQADTWHYDSRWSCCTSTQTHREVKCGSWLQSVRGNSKVYFNFGQLKSTINQPYEDEVKKGANRTLTVWASCRTYTLCSYLFMVQWRWGGKRNRDFYGSEEKTSCGTSRHREIWSKMVYKSNF